jgi:ligand-binding sensor domain-containing protein
VRILFVLIFSIAAFSAGAQQPFPAGVANTYTLSEKDGYPGINHTTFLQTADGIIYTTDYTGNLYITGNNYHYSFDTLRKLKGTIAGITNMPNKEVWVIATAWIAVIKDAQVKHITNTPFNTSHISYKTDSAGIFLFAGVEGKLQLWHFDGAAYTKIDAGQFPFSIKPFASCYTATASNGAMYLWKAFEACLEAYKFNQQRKKFEYIKHYALSTPLAPVCVINENHFLFVRMEKNIQYVYRYKDGCITPTGYTWAAGSKKSLWFNSFNSGGFPLKKETSSLYTIISTAQDPIADQYQFISNELIHTGFKITGGAFFCPTNNKPLYVFSCIKKYERLFNNTHANSIFTVRQDAVGRIWAGSYQGKLTIVHNNKSRELPENKYMYMNGGSFHNGYMYLIGEGNGGIVQFDSSGIGRRLMNDMPQGFYTFVTHDKKWLYYGTTNAAGLWQTTMAGLEKRQPVWNKIDSSKGSNFYNILTITEDTLGRIWYGHGRAGLALYQPQKDRAATWLKEDNASAFGAFSSLTDSGGTVWIGSVDKGLWYYSDYSKTAQPSSFKSVKHPLLQNATISAMTMYKQWLVLATMDKILLLNTHSLLKKSKVVLRYLNPVEASFSSLTEQNTMLTSHTDSTIWFSTSDMLYQWNVTQWLQQPVYIVQPKGKLQVGDSVTLLSPSNTHSLAAGQHSFTFFFHYQSADNLPRYISVQLVKDSDSLSMPSPSLLSQFDFQNLSAGNYRFVVDVFETDGSTSRYEYPVSIQKYIWQQWWFWAIVSLLVLGTVTYILYSKRKREMAEQAAKLKEAELHAYKEEQQKKLAQLQLVTLSNQFRPHFILNALNAIGARMDDNPETETVLGRLGESVNIIFNHAKEQKIAHAFADEWRLVLNVIEIHRLMYLKNMEAILPEEKILEKFWNLQMPLGLLQIPVENALLHGLSNKHGFPWILEIAVSEDETFFYVSVKDNGVGRAKAATLSNFTRHGTGMKNIADVLAIVNTGNADKISIQYKDDIYADAGNVYGTKAIIAIPKQFTYAK